MRSLRGAVQSLDQILVHIERIWIQDLVKDVVQLLVNSSVNIIERCHLFI
jgi:hypothetical protein